MRGMRGLNIKYRMSNVEYRISKGGTACGPSNVRTTTWLRPLVILSLLLAVGCWDTPQERLIGLWRGQPTRRPPGWRRKSEADAARRAKAGLPPLVPRDAPAVPGAQATEPTAQLAADPMASDDDRPSALEATQTPVTDWETTDFEIELRFLPREKIRMSLGGEKELEGSWEVIARSLDRVTIEIETASTTTSETTSRPNSNVAAKRPEIRRFVIRFEGEEKDRFTLQEEGADPDVGSLLFHKVRRVAHFPCPNANVGLFTLCYFSRWASPCAIRCSNASTPTRSQPST